MPEGKAPRFFRRALAREVPDLEEVGWRRVARDESPSVGELALMEWDGPDAAPPEVSSMSEDGKPNGVRMTAAVVAAVVSALAGTGASVATHHLDPPAAATAPEVERRLSAVEARIQTAEVERAAFAAGVTEKLSTLIEKVSSLDAKLDRLGEPAKRR